MEIIGFLFRHRIINILTKYYFLNIILLIIFIGLIIYKLSKIKISKENKVNFFIFIFVLLLIYSSFYWYIVTHRVYFRLEETDIKAVLITFHKNYKNPFYQIGYFSLFKLFLDENVKPTELLNFLHFFNYFLFLFLFLVLFLIFLLADKLSLSFNEHSKINKKFNFKYAFFLTSFFLIIPSIPYAIWNYKTPYIMQFVEILFLIFLYILLDHYLDNKNFRETSIFFVIFSLHFILSLEFRWEFFVFGFPFIVLTLYKMLKFYILRYYDFKNSKIKNFKVVYYIVLFLFLLICWLFIEKLIFVFAEFFINRYNHGSVFFSFDIILSKIIEIVKIRSFGGSEIIITILDNLLIELIIFFLIITKFNLFISYYFIFLFLVRFCSFFYDYGYFSFFLLNLFFIFLFIKYKKNFFIIAICYSFFVFLLVYSFLTNIFFYSSDAYLNLEENGKATKELQNYLKTFKNGTILFIFYKSLGFEYVLDIEDHIIFKEYWQIINNNEAISRMLKNNQGKIYLNYSLNKFTNLLDLDLNLINDTYFMFLLNEPKFLFILNDSKIEFLKIKTYTFYSIYRINVIKNQ